MKFVRIAAVASLATVALYLSSCVELTGQRLSLYYDKDKDELSILLFYDGIHESAGGEFKNDSGNQQIPEFIKNGDIMLLDWPFHLQMAELRKEVTKADDEDKPAFKAFLESLLDNLHTYPVGRYRDGHGRIGAAQMIVLSHAGDVLPLANAAISEGILSNASNGKGLGDEASLTWAKIRAAAEHKHAWISLDGHAVRLSVPVNENEWAALKAQGLGGVVDNILENKGGGLDGPKGRASLMRPVQGLTSASLTYSDTDGLAVLRIGSAKTPNTIRLSVRDEYNDQLEAAVAENVKVDLDETIGRRLLQAAAATRPAAVPGAKAGGTPAPPDPGVDAVLAWGPPEMKFAGLLALAKGKDAAAAQAAVKMLGDLGANWNTERGYPPAPGVGGAGVPPASGESTPGSTDDRAVYLDAWQRWLKLMDNFPLSEKHKPLDAPATQPAN